MSTSWNLGSFLNNPAFSQSQTSSSSASADSDANGETLTEAYTDTGFSFTSLRSQYGTQADFYAQAQEEWEDTHGAVTVGTGDAGLTTLDDADSGGDDDGGGGLDVQA